MHPLVGRKQSAEHIAKRTALLRTKGAYEKNGERITNLNKSRIGTPLSPEHKAKISQSMKGKRNSLGVKRDEKFRRKLSDYWSANKENHNNYKDGLSAERSSLRQTEMSKLEYRLWRETVLKRDNFTCVACDKRGGKLQVDHIKPWSLYPELRYEINNGRTLCVNCHRATDTYCSKMRFYALNYQI